MERDEALRELQKPLYPDLFRQQQDVEYVCRKLGFSEEEWNDIMRAPPASHDDYPGYYTRLKQFRALRRSLPF